MLSGQAGATICAGGVKMVRMDEIALSDYGRGSTTPSPVNRMMSAFSVDFREGIDINLGVGYVSEQTIPHQHIAEAIDQVIAHPERHKAPFNYGGAAGSENLIQAIRRYYVAECVGNLTQPVLDTKRIIIGVSGATSLLNAIAQVLRPGIVVTTDPIYYIYCEMLERAGFTLLTVPEDEQGIDTDVLATKLSALGERQQQISFVYAVTVNNPTCTILSNQRRIELVRQVTELSHRLGRRIPLFVDTAYDQLIHDPQVATPDSVLLYDELGIVYELGTLSKVLAPTLRIGFMIGDDRPLVDAIVQNVSDTGFSAPLLAQEIAALLLDEHGSEQLRQVRAGYRNKAVAVRSWIDRYLGTFLSDCRGGQAGFYYYLTFRDIETHERSAFFIYLARTDSSPADCPPRVIYIPGEFCVHRDGDMVEAGKRQLRLSYGFESLPQIEKALQSMSNAADRVSET